ncbi:MAG: MotA/TolQ/ExbB proton channel family protein [Pseudomonadales bacterium]|nr:MotA/TolQ/ExbB proton channel family protein [Pseudomonadales bacterium]
MSNIKQIRANMKMFSNVCTQADTGMRASSWMRALWIALLLALGSQAFAQAAEEAAPPAADDLQSVTANSLDELLKNVEQRRVVESRTNVEREQRFAREKASQAKMLEDAKAERRREEQKSDRLETTFDENEIRIGDLQEQLDRRLGQLKELFGVLQQVAGDTRGLFEGSLITAQIPNRGEWLSELAKKMGTSTELATIEEMETLWYELQREMTESGKVVRFPGTVVKLSGDKVDTDIVRVGAFALIAEGEYVRFEPGDEGTIIELARQPSARFARTAADLQNASPDEIVEFGVDPTRGSLLALLIQASTWGDRIGTPFGGISKGDCWLPFCDGQGGSVGSVIILVGILGVLLAIERLITLSMVGAKVSAQKKSDTANTGNPLGRVLKVYDDNKNVDVETLEMKLGEAILGETPKLTRNITLIQVISVVAPLLGLLGTVIGMITTFQAITLFGTGDPKTMAGGISQALVTTVLGLVVAIPTTLLHAIVAARSRSVIHVLEEQSAGIVADHAEKSGRALG